MTWVGLAHPALGGSYRDSAHGDPVNGVYAAVIDPKYAEYSAGNCAHCHQMHASIEERNRRLLTGQLLMFFQKLQCDALESVSGMTISVLMSQRLRQ
jgi:hypothetical protein